MSKTLRSFPLAPAEIKARLIREFSRGEWYSESDLHDAAQAVIDTAFLDTGWRWSVGTTGSMHFSTGFSRTKEEAETRSARVFHGTLSRNPVLGTLPDEVYRETQPQRAARLMDAMADALNPRIDTVD